MSNSVDPAIPTEAPQCIHIEQCRTVWSIIISCASTIFLCVWVAIHMNIPEPNESRWSILTRRVGVMLFAIFAPDVIVVWAAREFYNAGLIAQVCELTNLFPCAIVLQV